MTNIMPGQLYVASYNGVTWWLRKRQHRGLNDSPVYRLESGEMVVVICCDTVNNTVTVLNKGIIVWLTTDTFRHHLTQKHYELVR
jgi:hypothetical protein